MFDDLRARRIDAALAAAALTDLRLVPVATSWRENHRWVDHDLCALVERWRGAVLDPAELTPSARAACHAAIARVARVAPVLPDPGFQTRWWITLNGREAGTLATARFVGRGGTLAVFALHVSPAHRRAGVASDALALAEQAARTVGLEGVSTELRWGEREALRFLVRRGFRLRAFRRALALGRGTFASPHDVEVAGDEARFLVRRGGARTLLVRATRGAEGLTWERTDACRAMLDDVTQFEDARDAEATFALALALEAWPLGRAGATTSSAREHAMPEALAQRIARWESEGAAP